MARGLNEKIIFRVRKGLEEEGDRIKAKEYFDNLINSKDNNGTKMFTKESEHKDYFDIELVIINPDKKIEEECIVKGFKEKKK